jgi:hypothetical protein
MSKLAIESQIPEFSDKHTNKWYELSQVENCLSLILLNDTFSVSQFSLKKKKILLVSQNSWHKK